MISKLSFTLMCANALAVLCAPASPWTSTAGAAGALDDALAAMKRGEYPRVLEIAAEVPAEHADYARVQYVAGETYLAVGDAKSAGQAFARTLERRPEAVPALLGLGRSLLVRAELAEAETHLGAALELAPEDPAAKRAFGELRLAQGEVEEARELLSAVYELDPSDPQSVRALFELHLRAGELDPADALVVRFAKKHKKHPLGPCLQGVVLERRGEPERAIAAYERALELDERYLDAHKNLAILGHTLSDTYRIQARNELALAHYERYFALGGRDPALERVYQQMKSFLQPATDGGR